MRRVKRWVEVGGTYMYAWGNNARRVELKGRSCKVLVIGRMFTCLVEFIDTGELVTTDWRALRPCS